MDGLPINTRKAKGCRRKHTSSCIASYAAILAVATKKHPSMVLSPHVVALVAKLGEAGTKESVAVPSLTNFGKWNSQVSFASPHF